MSTALPVVLGAPDPLQSGDGEWPCLAQSGRLPGLPAPFVCTRAAGHVLRKVGLHVASGPYESRLPVAVAMWTDSEPTPRVIPETRR